MKCIKRFFRAIGMGASEAVICFVLGLKESLIPSLLIRSAGWCLLVGTACIYGFYNQFSEIALFCVWIALFSAMSVTNFAVFGAVASAAGVVTGSVAAVNPIPWLNLLAGVGQVAVYLTVYFVLFFSILFFTCMMLGVRLVIHMGFFQRVQLLVEGGYPSLVTKGQGQSVSALLAARYRPTKWLGVSGWTLMGLLIPLYNGILILLSLPYLSMRLLLAPAIARYADGEEQLKVIRAQRVSVLFLGIFNLLLACVPLVNLLLPVTLSASACHLYMRALVRQRGTFEAVSVPDEK